MDSAPIVALAGQVGTPLIGNDAFQEVDTIGITMPISKHSYQAMKPSEIPEMIRSSFYIARTGRPGPVVVDLPKMFKKEN